jgi:hypothetical protein
MRYMTHRRIAALALVALVGACKSDSSVAPSNQTPATLDQAFSAMTQPFSNLNVTPAPSTSMSVMPPVPRGGGGSCVYDASVHGFVCPTYSVTGLSITQSYKLYDALHNPQSQYTPASTDAVQVITAIAGTVKSAAESLTVNSTQDVTLSGLQSGVHVLNGTTNIHSSGTINAPTAQPFDDTAVIAFANIVLPVGDEKWPRSGTITIDVVGSGFTGTAHTVLVLTFNGTNKPTITVNGIAVGCFDLSGATACG